MTPGDQDSKGLGGEEAEVVEAQHSTRKEVRKKTEINEWS